MMIFALFLCLLAAEEIICDTDAANRHVKVNIPFEEVWGYVDESTQIFCEYSILNGEDLPVAVTWKRGNGPRYATEIASCSGYTNKNRTCVDFKVLDSEFDGRVQIAPNTPSLELTQVLATDQHNYWCQVAIEDPANIELDFDMRSVVLRIYDFAETPRFNSATVNENIVQSTVSSDVVLDCDCTGSQCSDVYWYKGPTDVSYKDYDLVYTRITKPYNDHPGDYETYTSYNDWIGRANANGFSLIINNLAKSDSGRYWCEVRDRTYRTIGELAYDVKSIVLNVGDPESFETFTCNGKADGLYSDLTTCSAYYQCVGEETYHRQCPYGTIFNSVAVDSALACQYSANVPPPCGTMCTTA